MIKELDPGRTAFSIFSSLFSSEGGFGFSKGIFLPQMTTFLAY